MTDSPAALAPDVLARLHAATGPGQVLTGEELLAYADPYAFSEEPLLPAAVVLPESVQQVQAVMAAAASSGTPVWPVSRGRNYGYGGAAPRTPGSVVLDLQRMAAVVEVNDELGYAVVEPGVSFLDLYAHLRAIGSTLAMSVPDIGWGSVLGNALERGIGYAQLGDHSAQVCGLEVVLADGTLVRTGMGAVEGSSMPALYRGGYGPSLDGLFLQSNLGVVTRMGVWLAPRSQTVLVCMARTAMDDDLRPLVDALRPLLLDGTIQSPAIVGNAPVIASMISERQAWHTGPGTLPAAAVEAMVERLHLGWWNARFALYGPRALAHARLDVVRAALAAVPGLELAVTEYDGDTPADQIHPADHAQLGVPGTALVAMAAWRGGEPAHTDLSLVCPNRSTDILRQRALLRDGVERHGFDYTGGFTMYPRHCISLALVSFDRSDATQRQAIRTMFPELIAEAAALGYAPYRSHTAFMDEIAESYGAGGAAHLVSLLKAALDPLGILAPGKQGIWPKVATRVG